MEKPNLPKLETEEFVTRQAEPVTFKKKASRVIRGIRIKHNEKRVAHDDDIDIAYKRLLVKTGICAAIAVAILVVSSVSTPASADVTKAVNYVVNHEFDVDEDIGRLKFVQALDETESVFSVLAEDSIVYPADGNVVMAFGEGGSIGVRMSAVSPDIMNIAKGTVVTVGEIDGEGYVKVLLDSGESIVYYNLIPCVQVDDIVMPGQVVGEVSQAVLYMEMQDGETYIDPIAYINTNAGVALQ